MQRKESNQSNYVKNVPKYIVSLNPRVYMGPKPNQAKNQSQPPNSDLMNYSWIDQFRDHIVSGLGASLIAKYWPTCI